MAKERMTIPEIGAEIVQTLRNRMPRKYWAPRGVLEAIRGGSGKEVGGEDFEEALNQEVEAGSIKRGKDRIWLSELD